MRASLCRGVHPSWRIAKKPCECVDKADCYKSTAILLSIWPPTLEALVAVCNGEGALLHGQLVKFGELLKDGGRGSGEQTNTDRKDEGEKRNVEDISKLKILWKLPFLQWQWEEKYEMEHETNDLV